MDKGHESYRRFLEGDNNALGELIEDYRDGLILFLLSYTSDVSAAESLAEDTFVRLAVKRPRNSGKSSFKTWLYTIGRNIAIDYLRKRRREKLVPLENAAELAAELESLEHACIRSERKRIVHRAMEKLEPRQHRVLWLRYFEDMTSREAAKVMGISTHAAEALASRARSALRILLEKEGFTDENLF
ncbi:MAG: RNA polymerase sigma factor [Clostridia bacterium]|nr:RNA polymerase sigma factor [Clostridia bacterium]